MSSLREKPVISTSQTLENLATRPRVQRRPFPAEQIGETKDERQQSEQNLLPKILDISRRMAETRALEPLLNYVIDEAIALVGAERGYIVLVRPDSSLEIRVKRGQGGETLADEDDPISTSVFNEVVATAKPVIIRDAINDPQFGVAQSVICLQLRSIMCVPFIARGETIGAIYVENRSIRNRFKEDDLPPLTLFANQAAIAIENAAINDDLEARVSARTKELERSWSEVIEANRLRTVWLSNVAHDLRAPLGIVTASLSFLQEGGLGSLNPDQLEWIGKSLQAVQHTSSLTNDLFDLFKIETGGLTSEREMVAMQEFLQNVYDVGLGLPWPKTVALKLDISPPLPHLHIDPLRIRQVLINLLSNAHKFTSQGSVTLIARYQADRQEMLLGVKDTGEGIAADKVELLFQRFQQVDHNTQRRRQGAGLGLAICRELVEMHGGRIWVESEPGVGSSFFFTLPRSAPVSVS